MSVKNSPADSRKSFRESYRVRILKGLAQSLLREMEALDPVRRDERAGPLNFYEEVERLEVDMILYALQQSGGHQRRAARMLGLKATTLNAKIKHYGIKADAAPLVPPQLEPAGELKSGTNGSFA